jgi:RHS repeat-associated protein
VTDEHGSIVNSITDDGAAGQTRDYDPFGVELTSSNPPNPSDATAAIGEDSLGYLGAHLRPGVYGSSLIHMGARVYDPSAGRFLSRDSVAGDEADPQTQNPYAYGLNSPARNYDLDGRTAIPWPRGIPFPPICVAPTQECVDFNEEQSQQYYDAGEQLKEWLRGQEDDAWDGLESGAGWLASTLGKAGGCAWNPSFDGSIDSLLRYAKKKSRGGPGNVPTGPKRSHRHNRPDDNKQDRPYRKRPPGHKGPWPPKN